MSRVEAGVGPWGYCSWHGPLLLGKFWKNSLHYIWKFFGNNSEKCKNFRNFSFLTKFFQNFTQNFSQNFRKFYFFPLGRPEVVLILWNQKLMLRFFLQVSAFQFRIRSRRWFRFSTKTFAFEFRICSKYLRRIRHDPSVEQLLQTSGLTVVVKCIVRIHPRTGNTGVTCTICSGVVGGGGQILGEFGKIWVRFWASQKQICENLMIFFKTLEILLSIDKNCGKITIKLGISPSQLPCEFRLKNGIKKLC